MPKHKRGHHRKHRRIAVPTATTTTSILSDENIPTVAPVINETSTIVKKDLRLTIITTLILICSLSLLSYINRQKNWTIQAGDSLYKILHIR